MKNLALGTQLDVPLFGRDPKWGITQNDLARAVARLDTARLKWVANGSRVVPDADLSTAEDHVLEGEQELQVFRQRRMAWPRWKHRALKAIAWFLETTKTSADHPWLPCFIVATGMFGLVAWGILLVARPGVATFFTMGIAVFVAAGAVSFAVLRQLKGRDVRQLIADMARDAVTLDQQIAITESRLRGWVEYMKGLFALKRIRDEFVAAEAEHQRLVDVFNSRKYQLLHTDWRSLRGVPFEHFLVAVFQTLGYTVTTTKASGDQGVDLIVEGSGRRIAVQTKGYSKNVGNKSVQEAFAGMAFYNCQACIVITNSRFTSGAIKLAAKVKCQLIDQRLIPDLIIGKVL